MSKISPVRLSPALKEYIWGGTKLKTDYNKKTALETVAESWELSAHPDGESKITGGPYDGLKLSEYISLCGADILGNNCEKHDHFPILIKLIDAHSDLSFQVHPSDEYALKNEGEYGKTEMWYILDCEDGASLYYGFKRDITKDELKAAIKSGTLTDLLNRVPVHSGDVFFIPSGTVHAIGAGILICEIQQNSNTTYRVYDYDRKDKNGQTRPLHIEKALEVSDLKKTGPAKPPKKGSDVVLAKCEYFTVRKITANGDHEIDISKSSFHSLIAVKGAGSLEINGETVNFIKGDSIFIPAQDGKYRV